MTATVLSASLVPSTEIEALSRLQHDLPKDSTLGKALATVAEGIRDGVDVTIARDDELLTPAHAAAILGVSRTHLYKILDSGALPFQIVGKRDRRITSRDLRAFADRTEAFRASDAVSIANRDRLEDEILDAMP